MLVSEPDRIHVALADLLVDRAELITEIEAGFYEQPPLSEEFIRERRGGR